MKRVVLALPLLAGGVVSLTATEARAEFPAVKTYLGIEGGYHLVLRDWQLGDGTKTPDSSPAAGLRFGCQFTPRWAAELSGTYIPTTGTTVLNYDANLLYHLTGGDWAPYAVAGVGAYNSFGGDLGTDFDPNGNVGLGLRGLLAPWVALRLQARDVFSDGNDIIGANNLEFTLGFDFFLGKSAPKDTDKDGVTDDQDKCVDVAGPVSNGGCPIKDTDGDGILDPDDKCPAEAGTAAESGCPIADKDKDGVPDAKDLCPDVAGSAATGGCPDRDGDGTADMLDKCPDQPANGGPNGCPVAVADKDADGIADATDKCPDVAGPAATGGCPDKDGDGVVDSEDKCPDQAGTAAEHGCVPSPMAKFSGTIKGVNFETGKWDITPESAKILDAAIEALKPFPKVQLRIEGHTDNMGGAPRNLLISKNRAKAVKDYLVSKGIDAKRLKSEGFGGTKPIQDNATPEGRTANRRIDFIVVGQ